MDARFRMAVVALDLRVVGKGPVKQGLQFAAEHRYFFSVLRGEEVGGGAKANLGVRAGRLHLVDFAQHLLRRRAAVVGDAVDDGAVVRAAAKRLKHRGHAAAQVLRIAAVALAADAIGCHAAAVRRRPAKQVVLQCFFRSGWAREDVIVHAALFENLRHHGAVAEAVRIENGRCGNAEFFPEIPLSIESLTNEAMAIS